jgi:hypothetical protein
MPGSRANIDHIAIGPSGVWVIESKDYGGRLTVRRDEIYVAGRRRTQIIDQAIREAEAVEAVLVEAGMNAPVMPILCVHRADLPWRTPVIDGVSIVSGRGLLRRLDGGAPQLAEATVELIARRLDYALRRA